MNYNKQNNIVPKTVTKNISNTLQISKKTDTKTKKNIKDITQEIEKLKALMNIASKNLDFEQAIILREQINELKKQLK